MNGFIFPTGSSSFSSSFSPEMLFKHQKRSICVNFLHNETFYHWYLLTFWMIFLVFAVNTWSTLCEQYAPGEVLEWVIVFPQTKDVSNNGHGRTNKGGKSNSWCLWHNVPAKWAVRTPGMFLIPLSVFRQKLLLRKRNPVPTKTIKASRRVIFHFLTGEPNRKQHEEQREKEMVGLFVGICSPSMHRLHALWTVLTESHLRTSKAPSQRLLVRAPDWTNRSVSQMAPMSAGTHSVSSTQLDHSLSLSWRCSATFPVPLETHQTASQLVRLKLVSEFWSDVGAQPSTRSASKSWPGSPSLKSVSWRNYFPAVSSWTSLN